MYIAYQGLKIAVAIGFPVLLKYAEPEASLSTKTLLGIGVYALWTCLEVLYYTKQAHSHGKHNLELWEMRHALDNQLNEMRRHCHSIAQDAYHGGDLFLDYFGDRFSELLDALRAAADHKTVLVKNFHFQRTERLLRAFKGDGTGLLRYVWIVREGEELFDEHWRHYCDQIFRCTKDGSVSEIRALLVLGKGVTSNHDVVKALAGFYEFAKGHKYKLVDESHYKHQKRDAELENEYIDFGIYGNRYIYLTQSYGQIISGNFCKDTKVIDRYTKFFDGVWNSHHSTTLPKTTLKKVTLKEFLDLHMNPRAH